MCLLNSLWVLHSHSNRHRHFQSYSCNPFDSKGFSDFSAQRIWRWFLWRWFLPSELTGNRGYPHGSIEQPPLSHGMELSLLAKPCFRVSKSWLFWSLGSFSAHSLLESTIEKNEKIWLIEKEHKFDRDKRRSDSIHERKDSPGPGNKDKESKEISFGKGSQVLCSCVSCQAKAFFWPTIWSIVLRAAFKCIFFYSWLLPFLFHICVA